MSSPKHSTQPVTIAVDDGAVDDGTVDDGTVLDSAVDQAVKETITIDGNEYVIPLPWRGNKLDAPELNYEDFLQIPVEFTKDNTQIYVLAEIQPPLVDLLNQAKEDNIELLVESGYRSARYQKRIISRMLRDGREFEEIMRYVAPPGYSQHMLGTAVDFYPSNWRFAQTPQYEWLQEHGPKYGFEETYHRTNAWKMPWEAWHWNYRSDNKNEKRPE